MQQNKKKFYFQLVLLNESKQKIDFYKQAKAQQRQKLETERVENKTRK